LAIYGAMRRWSAQHFRATLQGYFLPGRKHHWHGRILGCWAVGSGGNALLSGLSTRRASGYMAGPRRKHRSEGETFLKYVYAGLAIIGVLLLIQELR